MSVGTILLLGSISASAAFLVDSLFLNEEVPSGNGTSTITSTDEALALATTVVREALDYLRDTLARFR